MSVFFHYMRLLNLVKLYELKIIARGYDMLLLTESWLSKLKEIFSSQRVNRIGEGVKYGGNH